MGLKNHHSKGWTVPLINSLVGHMHYQCTEMMYSFVSIRLELGLGLGIVQGKKLLYSTCTC
jgi:hypothetical protein